MPRGRQSHGRKPQLTDIPLQGNDTDLKDERDLSNLQRHEMPEADIKAMLTQLTANVSALMQNQAEKGRRLDALTQSTSTGTTASSYPTPEIEKSGRRTENERKVGCDKSDPSDSRSCKFIT